MTSERPAVLVIDVDTPISTALRRGLSGLYTILVANTGRKALDIIATSAVDAIVCDMSLPDMTALDFYESLALSAPNLVRRTIFMTAGIGNGYELVSKLDGRWIEKPFHIAALRERLAKVLTTAPKS